MQSSSAQLTILKPEPNNKHQSEYFVRPILLIYLFI